MSLMDEIIAQAQQNGDFDRLPGAGKPLDLRDDPHTPEDKRLAHKILRENDLAPDWILESKSLEAEREKLMAQIRAAQAAGQKSAAADMLRTHITAYNRRVLTYNLKVPRGVVHKPMIDLRQVMKTP